MAQALALVPANTLMTATPEEGRQLAIKLARLVVKYAQADEAKRQELREVYANDAAMLIALAHVVAVEFSTIAAANDYWRQ